MTPSEKSESLLTKFYSAHGANLPFQTSKECAIICVEQIMEVLNNDIDDPGNGVIIYWNEVLRHIKNS